MKRAGWKRAAPTSFSPTVRTVKAAKRGIGTSLANQGQVWEIVETRLLLGESIDEFLDPAKTAGAKLASGPSTFSESPQHHGHLIDQPTPTKALLRRRAKATRWPYWPSPVDDLVDVEPERAASREIFSVRLRVHIRRTATAYNDSQYGFLGARQHGRAARTLSRRRLKAGSYPVNNYRTTAIDRAAWRYC